MRVCVASVAIRFAFWLHCFAFSHFINSKICDWFKEDRGRLKMLRAAAGAGSTLVVFGLGTLVVTNVFITGVKGIILLKQVRFLKRKSRLCMFTLKSTDDSQWSERRNEQEESLQVLRALDCKRFHLSLSSCCSQSLRPSYCMIWKKKWARVNFACKCSVAWTASNSTWACLHVASDMRSKFESSGVKISTLQNKSS